MTVMYIGLCFSIAEMSPALPHAGGAYSFARTAMGPWGGYITGLAENMEYILTPAVIVVGIGGYLGAIFGTSASVGAGVVAAVLRRVRGAEYLGRGDVVPGFGAGSPCRAGGAGGLLDGRCSAFRSSHRWATAVLSARGRQRPRFVWNCRSRCGCIWASSNCRWPPKRATTRERDMPRGILYGLVTLIACSFLTVILSAGIAPGAAKVATSQRAAVSWVPNHLRRRPRNAHAGAGRLHRAGRELPHHHLRVWPPDLFALARGILPDAGSR